MDAFASDGAFLESAISRINTDARCRYWMWSRRVSLRKWGVHEPSSPMSDGWKLSRDPRRLSYSSCTSFPHPSSSATNAMDYRAIAARSPALTRRAPTIVSSSSSRSEMVLPVDVSTVFVCLMDVTDGMCRCRDV